MIKLIILDIDGVMTDGTKIYDLNGKCFAKRYCDRDFTAIKRFKVAGLNICFLSGDSVINEQMAKNRNIDFYLAKGKDKVDYLPELFAIYNVTPEETLYIGDDLFDYKITGAVKYKYCTSDSVKELKEICIVLNSKGGEGAIQELYERLVDDGLVRNISLNDILKIDSLETW
jgi:3-deoxy-D-manno-octulosonate 8-phosphate phosphatase (KDO 8-P phosphatase)